LLAAENSGGKHRMATRKIQRERVQDLNEADVREGDYVLYWMQSSQRADHNHAVSKRR
jgi:deoxyribodipyrimidine photo-lyase